jgi:oligoendopeptidase F
MEGESMPEADATTTQDREFPRQFVAADAGFGEWATAETCYNELAERSIETVEQFEKWLRDWSELDSAFDEEGVGRQIDMTRQTDDSEREQRFLHFITNVKPQREPVHHKLREKFIRCAERFSLPALRYEVLERSMRTAIEIYRDENVPLQTEDEKLQQQFQKITGAMTCELNGEEMTIQQVSRYVEEPDREVRERAWRVVLDRYARDAAALDEIYDKMVTLRHKIARNADCADFREYTFKNYERFDYTPEDCLAFHDAIEKVVVPATGRLAAQRKAKLGLETLRPWDMAVDPDQRPALRPFTSDEQLAGGCSRIFHKVNPELGAVFDTMLAKDLLDLGSRKGKAPGGYQATYDERRLPFIFMNAVGTEGDVRTLLHEGGHAFHTWACRNDPLVAYRHYPTEFAEVASMGMECLCLPHLDEFYNNDSNLARKHFFTKIVTFFPWMARVDAFQHYVYTNVEHDLQRRKDEWVKLSRRFSPHVDWSGLEGYDRNSWHQKLHFFEVPFYYVEYGIAQLGALQVWMNSKRDYEEAVAFYRNGLALGGSRPLPELFEAAGCKFDFSEKTLRPLIEAVMEEIERL